jgi:hypothetical protein
MSSSRVLFHTLIPLFGMRVDAVITTLVMALGLTTALYKQMINVQTWSPTSSISLLLLQFLLLYPMVVSNHGVHTILSFMDIDMLFSPFGIIVQASVLWVAIPLVALSLAHLNQAVVTVELALAAVPLPRTPIAVNTGGVAVVTLIE